MALVTGIILFTYSGFAQGPGPEKGPVGPGAADDSKRLGVIKEPLVNTDTAQRVREAINPSAAALVSFLPADIFAPTKEQSMAGALYPTSMRDKTAGKGGRRGDGNDDLAALAKQVRNPVSSLARVYFRSSLDFALAADREGWRYTMELEPVIPFRLNEDWNLISRTSLPLIKQDGISASTEQTGLGDLLQSVFISPNKIRPFFWGAGAALLIPTASDKLLGSGKLGLGPSLVVGGQQGGWSYGALARHIWSVAGHIDRPDVRSTFVQPFVAYTTKSAWTFSLDTESSYDWVGKQASVPIHFEVTKVVEFGRQPVSVGAGLRCWAATPAGGPQACGVRFVVTPLFHAR
jgi:hypothetical protein